MLKCWLRLLVAGCCALAPLGAWAHHLDRADLQRFIRPPLHVAERLPKLPVWPITSELEPDADAVGYVFESIDLAPVPGFEGTPINLLIALDRHGNFMDVSLLGQHEPVFLSGLGEAPLREFLQQYAGRSLRQRITVASAYGGAHRGADGTQVVLDGVTKATASIRIVNQTVLAAALAVAREQLGFAAPRERRSAKVRGDRFERLDFRELLAGGYVGQLRLSNREVERLFAGSEVEGIDAEALRDPEGTFVELYLGYLNAPTIGRSLLGDAGYREAMKNAADGQHLLWIASAGRYPIVEEDFVPGTAPPRLLLSQGELQLELRDANVELAQISHPPPTAAADPLAVAVGAAPPPRSDTYGSRRGATPTVSTLPSPPIPVALDQARVFFVPAAAGMDPAAAMQLSLVITRARGQILPRLTQREAVIPYQAPAALFEYPPEPPPEWLLAWQGRWPDLLGVAIMLAVLTLVLGRARLAAPHLSRLRRIRTLYLVFTLLFLGWYAQGQLSIVQVTGAVKSLMAGQGLASFLYDPVSLLLIAFTLVTFVVWGRGAFCGWLCPFGVLQEFVAIAARQLRLPQIRLREHWHRRLARAPLAVLLVLILAAAVVPQLAEQWVEIEPFKTAITVGFDRSWPYVAYAVLLLAAGAFVYKGFCRYLCPLGAAMRLGGKLRRVDWLARRVECGGPCQSCRHACAYQAIAPEGAIRYDDCFQCLDCVAIYNDERRCAAELFLARKGRAMAAPAAGGPEHRPGGEPHPQPALRVERG